MSDLSIPFWVSLKIVFAISIYLIVITRVTFQGTTRAMGKALSGHHPSDGTMTGMRSFDHCT